MSLATPIPRGSLKNTGYPVDYNLQAPLNNVAFPGDFPCRHRQRGPITAIYNAGQSIYVDFDINNPHKGGHCQFGLSYDNENFVVLRTMFRNCFDVFNYNIPIPAGARGGNAVFSWSWINADGNREFYMNCADIHINGPLDGSVTGQRVMVANMPNTPFIDQ
ncbi:hypothetical protein BDF19DRAFT_399176 [Syncephalis fuscata]|nr:hypothetical protein BDF19DRAFT_399176 [Syncephalis fuscata]